MTIPLKILTRKDEITAKFTRLVIEHLDAIVHGQTAKMLHVRDFADQLCIHPTHLSNTVKLTLGESPCDFIEAHLIAQAKKLLRTTELSVAEIGEQLTYSEATNFVKFFKRRTGTTPRRYRQACCTQAGTS